jgi:A/G-specific adenine glycosylase
LPGIGAYTAAAIAAIAFGADATPVDTNVERVVARLHALEEKAAIDAAARVMTPSGRAGDFAQAMMDLGATVCRPRAPDCPACPLRADCLAYAGGDPEAFPEPKTRKARPQRHGIAHWVERDGALWLVRRPANGMLGGMAALPGGEWAEAVTSARTRPLARVRHVFTHFTLDLDVVTGDEAIGDGWWQPLDRLHEAGLPTLYRRACDLVLARSAERRAA